MTHTKCQSQRTFRTLCLTSSFLFMIGIIMAFVPIVPFVDRFYDNDYAFQIISVLGWSLAGSAVLPELCIDFVQLKDTTAMPRRPDYGVHSRYGCAKNIFLCLVQSITFLCGCVVIGLAEYRAWDTSSSDPQQVVDWQELYLIGAGCMAASAMLATSVTECVSCCNCCCCLQVPLPSTTISNGHNINGTPSTTTTIDPRRHPNNNIVLATTAAHVIVGNGLYLGGSLVLMIACVTDGWCNECIHGILLQKITYGCWVAASILWTIADTMLPTRCEEQNQQGQQHGHHQRHDPTSSDESTPSPGQVVPDQEMQLE